MVRAGSAAEAAGLVPLLSLDMVNGKSVHELGYNDAIEMIKSTRPLHLSFAQELDSGQLISPREGVDTRVSKLPDATVAVQKGRFTKMTAERLKSSTNAQQTISTSVLFVLPGPLGLTFTEADEGPAAVLRDIAAGSPGAANRDLRPGMRLVSFRAASTPASEAPRSARSLEQVTTQLRKAQRPLLLTFERPSPSTRQRRGVDVLALQASEEMQLSLTEAPGRVTQGGLDSKVVQRLQRADEAELLIAAQLADEQVVNATVPVSTHSSERSAATVLAQHSQEEADLDNGQQASVTELSAQSTIETTESFFPVQAALNEAIE